MPIEPGPVPARTRPISPGVANGAPPRRVRSWLSLYGLGAGIVSAALGADMPPPPARPRAEVLARPCLACHMTRHSGDPGPPALALTEARFVAAMQAFRNGTRQGSVMNRIARGYTDEDVVQLARFFAGPGVADR